MASLIGLPREDPDVLGNLNNKNDDDIWNVIKLPYTSLMIVSPIYYDYR